MKLPIRSSLLRIILILLIAPAAFAQAPAGASRTADDWAAQGLSAYSAKDYAESAADFHKALAADPKNRNDRIALANIYRAWSLQDQADENYVDAYSHLRSAFSFDRYLSRTRAADDLQTMALVLFMLARYSEAVALSKQAIRAEQSLSDKRSEMRSVNTLCLCFNMLDRFQEAIQYAESALVIEKKNSYLAEEAQTSANLALIYSTRLGNCDKAIAYDAAGIRDYQMLGDMSSQQNLLDEQGECYLHIGRYDQANACYEKALTLGRETHDTYLQVQTLLKLGQLFTTLGNNNKAEAVYQSAADLGGRDLERSERILTLERLGNCKTLLKKYEDAVPLLQEGISLAQKINSPQLEVVVLHTLAHNYENAHRWKLADPPLQRCLLLDAHMGDQHDYAETLNIMARIAISSNDLKEADECLKQALVQAHRLHANDTEAQSYYLSAQLFLKKKNNYAALQNASRALAGAIVSQDRSLQELALEILMVLQTNVSHRREAVVFGKLAVNMLQDMRRNARSFDATTQSSLVGSNQMTYRVLAELLIQQGRLSEAQQVLDLIKQKEFFEFVRRDAQDAPLGQTAMTPEEAKWRKQYEAIAAQVATAAQKRDAILIKRQQALTGNAAFSAADRNQLKQADSELENANAAFRIFLTRLSVQAVMTAKKPVDIGAATGLTQTMGRLEAGTAVLYTVVEDAQYRVIVITTKGQRAESYPIKADMLAKKVFAFRDALQDPSVDPRPLAHQLYQILIGPIEHDLQAAKVRTLLWSLDGVLRYLPMATLYDGHRYLVEQYRNETFTLASRSWFGAAASPHWTALGLGVSKAHPGFDALPAVPSELTGIIEDADASDQGAMPGAIMLDDQFTKSAMVDALAKQRYQVVHIASHFSFHPGDDTDSFLLLGDGSHLTLAEIKAMPHIFRDVDMLTLSACETAMGIDGADGREIEGCGVIAQRQGAHSVMASLWPVADAGTQQLMRAFYRWREVHPGASKAEALQQAQLSLLRGVAAIDGLPPRSKAAIDGLSPSSKAAIGILSPLDSKAAPAAISDSPHEIDFEADPRIPFAHPYYWAPFILIGNWK